MSRPIGALFHVPHGLSNAMLLAKCLRFALPGAVDRFCQLAQAIGVYRPGMSNQQGAQAFVDAVEKLLRVLQIPTPAQYGISRASFFAQLDKMAEDALASGSPANTRRAPTKEELVEIYRSLWD